MRRRMLLFAIIAVLLAMLFVRLGFWQLHRLGERRERNALVASRARAAAAPFEQVPADTSSRFRRATLTGIADYGHQLLLASRTRNGSPGVHVFTPVRIPGRDTAVLVNRGWVYSPDGATADLSRWREPDTLRLAGYVEPLDTGTSPLVAHGTLMRRVTLGGVRRALPYPVAPLYLVVQQPVDSGTPGVPARLPLPSITDEGPHLGYALQWFAFALIALVGAGIGVSRAQSLGSEGALKGRTGVTLQ